MFHGVSCGQVCHIITVVIAVAGLVVNRDQSLEVQIAQCGPNTLASNYAASINQSDTRRAFVGKSLNETRQASAFVGVDIGSYLLNLCEIELQVETIDVCGESFQAQKSLFGGLHGRW